MARILKLECNFLHRYFRCLLPKETMDVEVKIKTMRGTHTFRRLYHPGHILQSLEYKVPSLPIPNKKNENLPRTGGLAWYPTATAHQHLFASQNSLLQKTPILQKAEKRKRTKAPIKRRFKVRAIE